TDIEKIIFLGRSFGYFSNLPTLVDLSTINKLKLWNIHMPDMLCLEEANSYLNQNMNEQKSFLEMKHGEFIIAENSTGLEFYIKSPNYNWRLNNVGHHVNKENLLKKMFSFINLSKNSKNNHYYFCQRFPI